MTNLIEGKTGLWEVVIGLEVHAQIISESKLFSSSSTLFGSEPNTNVSFIDAGLPGVLPRPNKFCIEQAIKTGLALDGEINLVSYFDRKHYFYPDLPFGYQITQFYKPIMEHGKMLIELEDGTTKLIGITRLHVEQDAGKLLHEHHPNKSFVDLNRAGVGLMEIVSEPDIRSKLEAATYVNNLRVLLRSIGTCDGNMEEGSMRCDINISVRKPDEDYRTRVEVKNVNSIKFLQQAIDFEVEQQIATWENGGEVVQETKLFDPSSGKTFSLRKKEDSGGYRYVRDPDILPLMLDKSYVDEIREALPELPQDKKARFINDYSLSAYEATILTENVETSDFFEKSLSNAYGDIRNPKLVANWITTNLFALLNNSGLKISESKISPQQLGEMIDLIEEEVISSKIAKEVFDIMWSDDKFFGISPLEIVEVKGLKQITDTTEIAALVDKLCNENADKIEQIKAGKDKLLGWFVGQIMKETGGKANPEVVNSLLNKKISS
ncbi:MAG: Asp-tRNA(Asn)/Glu-tRNA(Gln) amidotransferase subunit GatB [Alphaproteobacteria bacterium]|jgi:aspartyl-tRNA(Asn)/glutamyl-tRNA(Gln) amidotransferase subunit B|nr:Asp-tRNA(Asn)/Glu-tRNA(Gln) amidotransferase subunit GatB [Alphaproteobacteria bacterium]